ncbi:hypothetical protein UH38_10085 [Aliterella atlantica CENA595]|uniref:Uncharacterized protein n=2 Tax=Aliterella TaxID=1827277 RepID=A0A0D8ZTG2_9CYAN|nr:hypothetical protein UH38_10085 [Aliterella atlantica CENA595]
MSLSAILLKLTLKIFHRHNAAPVCKKLPSDAVFQTIGLQAMHISQAPYRELFDAIASYQGTNLYADLLHPWCANAIAVKAWLNHFAANSRSSIPNASIEGLWQLYALSRVNDLLLSRLRDENAENASTKVEISNSNYHEFMRSLGLEVAISREFSPFYHEIVEVMQDKQQHAEITVVAILWDALMLGNMMFSRVGTCLAGGIANINKSIAETSTLYWTYQRPNRRCQDSSYGWGSNSQWRTSFRRDYKIDGNIYYNVDGKNNLNLGQSQDEELELLEQIELVKHRCFITVAKPDDDLFPYSDRYYQTV